MFPQQNPRAFCQTFSKIFGAAMYTKLISRMVLSKQEKKLVNSHFAVQLSSKITENYQETIRDTATFLKLVLVMKTSF